MFAPGKSAEIEKVKPAMMISEANECQIVDPRQWSIRELAAEDEAPTLRPPLSQSVPGQQNAASTTRSFEAPLIHVVDDVPHLTELYALILECAGFMVRTFHDRGEAL